MAKKNQRTKQKKSREWIIIAVAILVALAAGVIFGMPGNEKGSDSAQIDIESRPAATAEPVNAAAAATDYVQIDIQGYGSITAELYGDVAPITVANFLKLADEGFYDGLTFHRIISGFMIQGGDPKGNGTGGSDEKIKGEFSANGVENDISHVRGVLSMARSQMYDSASSQFFIMHADAPHLDGQYAAFGRVLSGIEIVDAICKDTPVTDNNGSVAAANQPVISAVRRIEKP